MAKPIGRTRRKLAELLQKEFPDRNGLPVVWSADRCYAATGYYRTSNSMNNDCCRWEAFAQFEGKNATAFAVHSYCTMTECVKAGNLVMGSDYEIYVEEKGN